MKCLFCGLVLLVGLTTVAAAAQVLVPDNGSGTAALPLRADYASQSPMQITDGLPPGSHVNIDAILETPVAAAEQPGGSLAGSQAGGGGPLFTWTMQGVGNYSSYNRTLSLPNFVPGVVSFYNPVFVGKGSNFEVHAAPRTPTAAVQSFDTDMFRMFSQISLVGDPDFDLLRITAGTDFGMPSPGHTTLTKVGADWNVDSFFDITYRIDFVGNNSGPFAGKSGSSTHTARFQAGMPVPEPASLGLGLIAIAAAIRARLTQLLPRRRGKTARPTRSNAKPPGSGTIRVERISRFRKNWLLPTIAPVI